MQTGRRPLHAHATFTARAVCLLTSISLVAAGGGCTRTRVHTFATYQPGGPPKLDRTPDVGRYKIKYSVADGEELETLHGSKPQLGAGQPIGFEVGPDGQLIAVAGEERFPALLPPDARYACGTRRRRSGRVRRAGRSGAPRRVAPAGFVG